MIGQGTDRLTENNKLTDSRQEDGTMTNLWPKDRPRDKERW